MSGQTAWSDVIAWAEQDAGLDPSGVETLIRLAASIIDEGNIESALSSFSEPADVAELAQRVAVRLYPADELVLGKDRAAGTR